MTFTVADYLLKRLESLGVDHLFGIPGDYILPLFESFENSKVAHIATWNYHLLPLALGGVPGEDVHTQGDLERALARAGEYKDGGPLLIEVHIDPWDAPEAFKLMSAALRSR